MKDKKLTQKKQEKLNQDMFEAIRNNDLPAVKKAVKAGADVNAKDKLGIPALQATQTKALKITKYLLQSGADPNIKNTRSETPMHHAAYNGDTESIKLLIEYNADMYAKDEKGKTPFRESIFRNKSEVRELFISYGYVPSEDDIQRIKDFKLFKAVKKNKLPSVKESIETGAFVNAKDAHEYSVLYNAVSYHDAFTANSLCTEKIKEESLKIIEYLLECGASPNTKNNHVPLTAFHNAVIKGEIDVVKLFLKYKADMYVQDRDGRTVYVLSVLKGYKDIAELFLSNGYVPSEEDMQKIKNYSLFKALENNDLSAVKEAVESGADVNIKDEDGYPVLISSIFKDIEITKYLLESVADINTQDYSGEKTVLHHTIYPEFTDKLKLFLQKGANMYIKDGDERTPFAEALIRENYDISELFILNGYIPSNDDFEPITETEREQIKTRFMELAAQVQEQKEKLTEEVQATEFAYADEVMEI